MSLFANSKLTSRVLRRTPLGPKPRSWNTGRFEAIRRAPLAARRHQWTDLRSFSLYSGAARPAASTWILHQHRVQPQSAASRNRLSSTMSSATNFFDFTVLDGKLRHFSLSKPLHSHSYRPHASEPIATAPLLRQITIDLLTSPLNNFSR